MFDIEFKNLSSSCLSRDSAFKRASSGVQVMEPPLGSRAESGSQICELHIITAETNNIITFHQLESEAHRKWKICLNKLFVTSDPKEAFKSLTH